jgi:hypothetical protein
LLFVVNAALRFAQDDRCRLMTFSIVLLSNKKLITFAPSNAVIAQLVVRQPADPKLRTVKQKR